MPSGKHFTHEQKCQLMFHCLLLNESPQETILHVFGYMEKHLRPHEEHINALFTKFRNMTEQERMNYQHPPVSRGTRKRGRTLLQQGQPETDKFSMKTEV
jgi:hypothetical protein